MQLWSLVAQTKSLLVVRCLMWLLHHALILLSEMSFDSIKKMQLCVSLSCEETMRACYGSPVALHFFC